MDINDINEYINKVRSFTQGMIDKFRALQKEYLEKCGNTIPCIYSGILGITKSGKIVPGFNTVQVYIDVLTNNIKFGNPKSGFFRQGECALGDNMTWPCSVNDIPGLAGLSPNDVITFYNNYRYALSHLGSYITTGQRNAPIYFPKVYNMFTEFWNNLYNQMAEKLPTFKEKWEATYQNKYEKKPPNTYMKYTYIIQDNKWVGLKGYTVTINGKNYTTNNEGAVTVELKKGTDPTKALSAVKNPLGAPINFKLVLNKGTTLTYHVPRTWPLKSPCTAENPCYHFTTYNWHENESTVKYTKDWKGNWILTESPAFKDISKIILVWWNGDSYPQDTKFSFLTLYDKASQRKSDPTQFFYYGVNPTIHMSLFGYAKAVIYTVLTNGKIIAYGPLTDYSNENAVSQIVPSYPTYPNYPTVPAIFKINPGYKIIGRPPKPANLPQTKSQAAAKQATNAKPNQTIATDSSTSVKQAHLFSILWILILLIAGIFILK